jgi:hypothetical protein
MRLRKNPDTTGVFERVRRLFGKKFQFYILRAGFYDDDRVSGDRFGCARDASAQKRHDNHLKVIIIVLISVKFTLLLCFVSGEYYIRRE